MSNHKLSTESPPFNPQRSGSGGSSSSGMMGSPSGNYRAGSRSRSNSPHPPRSNSPYPEVDNTQSNAVPKYTFQYQGESLEIRNVWAENVEEEMELIREVIEKYPYVAMDTEFPGVVAKPVTEIYTSDYHYKSLKVNIDLLKIIQLGMSFADEKGNFCPGCPCWQFNFKFDLEGDMFAQDSIDLLIKSGISFEDHATRGIDPLVFGELLMVSGLVLNDKVKWVSFHSGYDYGYLLKLLTTIDLPDEEKNMFDYLKIYFPTIYDIKYMTSLLDGHGFMGGLQKIADELGCQRIGVEHQAGSDSLLTMSAFFALAKLKFTSSSGKIEDGRYHNELFGYGNNHTVRKGGGPPAAMREISMGSLASEN